MGALEHGRSHGSMVESHGSMVESHGSMLGSHGNMVEVPWDHWSMVGPMGAW